MFARTKMSSQCQLLQLRPHNFSKTEIRTPLHRFYSPSLWSVYFSETSALPHKNPERQQTVWMHHH